MSANERSVILCTAGFDHTIRFWEAPTGLCHRTLQYTDSQVNRLELTSDKQYLGVGGNPHVRLYETCSNSPNPITSFDGHTNNVTALGFQKDRKWMFTGSEDQTVKIWDIRSPGYQRDYHCRSAVNTVVLHPNQAELICGDEDGIIRVWDLTANKCMHELSVDSSSTCSRIAIRSLSIATDATLLVAGNNRGAVFAWRMNGAAAGGSISSISSSNSSSSSSSSSSPTATTNSAINSSSRSNVNYFEPLPRIDAHNNYLLKCLLSPNVRILATASADKSVKLWNIDYDPFGSMNDADDRGGSITAAVPTPSSSLSSSSASFSSSAASSSSESKSETRDSHHISLDKTLSAHTSWVWDCTFSADSAYLVTASSDKTAKLWDVKSAEVILEYKGHHKAITAVALNDAS